MDAQITLSRTELDAIIKNASRQGALMAFEELATYTISEASKKLGICTNTLRTRIREGKIKMIDGKITGAEILRCLQIKKQIARNLHENI